MLLEGKKALVFGVVNDRSIAYGIAEQLKNHGARLGLSYAADPIKKRIEPIAKQLDAEFIMPCNVCEDEEIKSSAQFVKDKWGDVDIIIHSIAYANREDLKGRFIDTSRDGFKVALDVSSYSLVAISRAFEPSAQHRRVGHNPELLRLRQSRGQLQRHGRGQGSPGSLRALPRRGPGTKRRTSQRHQRRPVKTMAATAISGFNTILSKIEEKAPMHRNITIHDVGKAALFLASDLASGTTGETMFVDSGYNIMGV